MATPVVKNNAVPEKGKNTAVAPTFNATYQAATAAAAPKYNAAKSVATTVAANVGAGVQFGAFSSRAAAQAQVENVKSKLGVNADIESAPNGMFRVRVSGLSDAGAAQLKSRAVAAGIDSYVFH